MKDEPQPLVDQLPTISEGNQQSSEGKKSNLIDVKKKLHRELKIKGAVGDRATKIIIHHLFGASNRVWY